MTPPKKSARELAEELRAHLASSKPVIITSEMCGWIVEALERVAELERDARYYALLRGLLIREGYLLMTTCNVADEGEAPDLRISIELRDDTSTAVGHGTLAEAIVSACRAEGAE